jgi:hypothetical protein
MNQKLASLCDIRTSIDHKALGTSYSQIRMNESNSWLRLHTLQDNTVGFVKTLARKQESTRCREGNAGATRTESAGRRERDVRLREICPLTKSMQYSGARHVTDAHGDGQQGCTTHKLAHNSPDWPMKTQLTRDPFSTTNRHVYWRCRRALQTSSAVLLLVLALA